VVIRQYSLGISLSGGSLRAVVTFSLSVVIDLVMVHTI